MECDKITRRNLRSRCCSTGVRSTASATAGWTTVEAGNAEGPSTRLVRGPSGRGYYFFLAAEVCLAGALCSGRLLRRGGPGGGRLGGGLRARRGRLRRGGLGRSFGGRGLRGRLRRGRAGRRGLCVRLRRRRASPGSRSPSARSSTPWSSRGAGCARTSAPAGTSASRPTSTQP